MSKQPKLSVVPEDKEAIQVKTGTTLAKGQYSEARHGISIGTRILTDRPVLKAGRLVNQSDVYIDFEGQDKDTRDQILQLTTRSGQPKIWANRINAKDLSDLYSHCQKKSKEDTKWKIQEAGKVLAHEDNQVQLQYESKADVALGIARINHSCIPNVAVSWNESLEAYTVHAIRDIKNSEEIVYSYTYLPEPCDDRRVRLERWEIDCKCTICDYPYATDQEQRDTLLAQERELNPEARKASTGKLNNLLWGGDTLQHKDNRRRESRRFSMGLNRVAGTNVNNIGAYKRMLEALDSEDYLLEEKARLYWNLALEYKKDDEEHEPDAEERAKACRNALSLAKICYGDDNQFTKEIRAFVMEETDEFQKVVFKSGFTLGSL